MSKPKVARFRVNFFHCGVVKYAAGEDYSLDEDTRRRIALGDADEVDADTPRLQAPAPGASSVPAAPGAPPAPAKPPRAPKPSKPVQPVTPTRAPTRAELDAALAELPGTHTNPVLVIDGMRRYFGDLFTNIDEAYVLTVVQLEDPAPSTPSASEGTPGTDPASPDAPQTSASDAPAA